jgi:putative flippase GtrA
MAPEAFAFSMIGLGNLALYALIFNVLLFIGPVKSSIIATLLTTYFAYLANRHWTYRDRPRSAVRREYTLFFAFNLIGLLIQAGVVGIAKYGFGLSETGHDRLAFNVASAAGICIATTFRFWSYRTFVFRHGPAGDVAAEVADSPLPIAGPTQPLAVPDEATPEQLTDAEFHELTASLELEAELNAAEQQPTPGAARIH